MNEITITIRCNGQKESIPTQSDIILGDLIEQLASRSDNGNITAGQQYLATKSGTEEALDHSRSLADLGIGDGDIIDLAAPVKAGADNITIYLHVNGEKKATDTTSDIVLQDLLEQLSDRQVIPAGNFVVMKAGKEEALDKSCRLDELGVRNGDVLDLALPTKAG